MKSEEIFDAGYAIPLYDISQAIRTWRYRNEEYVIDFGAVWPDVNLPGVKFLVARIELVRSIHQRGEAQCRTK